MIIPNKTLVIRFSSIGDVVLASPLLRVLHTRFPSSQIDFVVRKEYSELIRYNPNLNHTFAFDAHGGFQELHRLASTLRRKKYDLIIDIQNNLRSRYIRSISGAKEIVVINKRIFARTMLVRLKKNFYLDIVSVADRYIEPVRIYGIENDAQGLEIFIPDETMHKVSGKISSLKLHKRENVVGFCPSAKHATKRWPEERFIEAGIRLVRELKAKIILFGGKSDTVLCTTIANGINKKSEGECAIEYSGQFSLLETAAAMQFCDVIVTNDSGLMHIAAAMKKKLVAIFGSTVREFGFFPVGTENIVIERKGLYCRPCSHIGRSNCPEGHFRCMNEIQIDDVVGSIKAVDGGMKT
ncbi:MAG: lipopolysaccharide heptosyltransferase II [Bacteroidota bacterium]|jgi:lipopolysaccharide heptosyltransferase II